MTEHELVDSEGIQGKIHTIRGLQVMLDRDLSVLYGVENRTINQAVKRNQDRFPAEFCFQLTATEFEPLRSQIVMSNEDKMGLRRPPFAFTEQGVSMLSAVLRSETAVQVSIKIINAFVAMRRFIASNALRFFQYLRLKTRNWYFNSLKNLEIRIIQTGAFAFCTRPLFISGIHYSILYSLLIMAGRTKKNILLY